ncbi:MAG: NIPSNAP family protein [Alphaproteobacteria bacterium]|jgi:hypothetical protein
MLFDVRTYTCRPGTIRKQMAMYEAEGLAIQTKHLGAPVFYGITETGEVNNYLHIWGYKDAADREKCRAAMQADPAWHAFLAKTGEAGYLIHQSNTLMTNAPFFNLDR